MTGQTFCSVVEAEVVSADEIIGITKLGNVIRVSAAEIRKQWRNSTGVRLMVLNEGDEMASISIIHSTNGDTEESESDEEIDVEE